jgi:hypothetical protein
MPDQPNSDAPQAVISALMASGFPFQTAIAQMVQETQNCSLTSEETPWCDETGADQFIDLIAQKGDISLVIECKKTQKETFTFLCPGRLANGNVNRARCIGLYQIQDVSHRMQFSCNDLNLMPKSVESMFCVVSTSHAGKDRRLLERDAQHLIRGTDAYEPRRKREIDANVVQAEKLFIPVLVTNAKLFIANYDPADISLDTGEFSNWSDAEVSSVSWVRFRKAFTSAGRELGDRTVFVVSAPAFQEFLNRLEVITTPAA